MGSIVLDVKDLLASQTDGRRPEIFRGCSVWCFISQHLSLFKLLWGQLTQSQREFSMSISFVIFGIMTHLI